MYKIKEFFIDKCSIFLKNTTGYRKGTCRRPEATDLACIMQKGLLKGTAEQSPPEAGLEKGQNL